MPAHPHAQSMAEYAKDAMETEEPWKRWEFWDGTEWFGLGNHPAWPWGAKYRRKVETVTIEVPRYPKPEVKAPPVGTRYYIPSPHRDEAERCEWEDMPGDYYRLAARLVHLTESAAAEHAAFFMVAQKAMHPDTK